MSIRTDSTQIPWSVQDVAQAAEDAGYAEEIRHGLVEVARYAEARLHGSRQGLLELLEAGGSPPHWTTVRRIFMGSYEKPQNFYETSIIPALKVIRSSADKFVVTPVTDKIAELLGVCNDLHVMGAVIGPAGRSKSFVTKDWVLDTPGAIYLDCPAVGGVGAFLRELARQVHAGSTSMNLAALASSIESRMDSSNTLIIDEVARILPSTDNPHSAGAKTMNFIQRLHDVRGVSVVFVATDVFQDSFSDPRLEKYLAQMHRRIVYRYEIPPVSKPEIKAICSAFIDSPDRDFLISAYNIATGPDGVGPLFNFLRHARLLAQYREQPLGLIHLDEAVSFCRARAS